MQRADRFKLKFHHETRALTVYAITVDDKARSKLKAKTDGEPSAMNTHTLPGESQLSQPAHLWTCRQVTALREQLGLRLESQKSPVDLMVIDSVEKPAEN